MYPILRIPGAIQSAITAVPVLPRKPVLPEEPEKYYFIDRPSSGVIVFPLLVIAFFIVGILVSAYMDSVEWSSILIWYALFAFAFGYKIIVKPLFTFISEQENYKNHVVSIDERYKSELHNYKNAVLPDFPKKLSAWKLEVGVKSESNFITKFREEIIKNVLIKSGLPLKHPKSNVLKKGALEKAILDFLVKTFPDKMYIDVTARGLEPKVSSKAPLPDFVIHDKVLGYNIAIEIDEPYDLEYGHPIHCVGWDDKRDEYFLNQNWVVIRFAEVQFASQAYECCDYIANVINEVTLGMAQLPVSGDYEKLTHIKHWSEDEAIAMEAAGFRETYLPLKANDSAINKYAFSDAIYRSNGPAIRKRRREQAISEELEREKQRVIRLRQEDDASSNYRYTPNEDNDLPF